MDPDPDPAIFVIVLQDGAGSVFWIIRIRMRNTGLSQGFPIAFRWLALVSEAIEESLTSFPLE